MAKILAIETATKVCSVALGENGAILAESMLSVPQVHVERLVICINDMLRNLHLEYTDLDAVAVSNGPGSFTGLRIGLSVAKGIVFARDKKLIAVPTLDAIAYRVRDFSGGRVIVPLLHARAEEFYYGSFRMNGAKLEKLGEYGIAEADRIVSEFGADTLFVGEGVELFSASNAAKLNSNPESLKRIQASAGEIVLLADGNFKRGEFSDLRSLAPLYIKDFVAIKRNPLSKLSRQTSGSRQMSGMEKD